MGEENCLPTVEESTEPPIRAQRSGNYHGPPTNAGQRTHVQPQARHEAPPLVLTAAHTLTASQVAEKLGVNIE
jgi:P-type Na+/K+ transporter